jgi:hypothetical protein
MRNIRNRSTAFQEHHSQYIGNRHTFQQEPATDTHAYPTCILNQLSLLNFQTAA